MNKCVVVWPCNKLVNCSGCNILSLKCWDRLHHPCDPERDLKLDNLVVNLETIHLYSGMINEIGG